MSRPEIMPVPIGSDTTVDEKSLTVVKSKLDQFVSEVHSKASLMTGWVSCLEPPTNPEPSDKAKLCLARVDGPEHFML